MTRKRKVAIAVAVAVGLAASVIVALRPGSPPPSVIVITVDTLRPDRLSLYGHHRGTSPHIDRLGEDSVRFENAVTPQTLTQPSTASMWTSLYPHQIGVVDNLFALADGYRTLAEILRDAAYNTAAFVSNYVLIRELSNLQQGFDLYDDWLDQRVVAGAERRAGHTIDRVVKWLRAGPEQPFFLWVHLMDPHGPYDPPPPFDLRYDRGRPASQPLRREQIPSYLFLDSLDPHFYIDRYDGEIAYADQEIGRLLAVLRESGLYEDALLILHADHGENLGEHGIYFSHGGNISEASLRIPLLLKLPKQRFGADALPDESDLLASVMDIAPTVLDVVGLPIPPHYEGQSLLQALRDPGERFLYVRARGNQVRGLRSQNRMLIHVLDSKNRSLTKRLYYRLDRAPGQRRSDSLDATGRELSDLLSRWTQRAFATRPQFPADRRERKAIERLLSDRQGGEASEAARLHREALESLGYIE